MSILKFVKNKGVGVLSTMSSIYSMSSMLTKFDQQDKRKQWKGGEKKTKKWATLNSSFHLVLQSMSFPLCSFFWSGPIGFPSKMMSCKLNHNLICLGPLSKDLGTNLKLLTKRNAQYHWTLLLGPLSKVALTHSH